MTGRFKIGDKAILQKHTLIWAREHGHGRSALIYEVVGIFFEGQIERITVQAMGEDEPAYWNIDGDLFALAGVEHG